MLSHSSSLSPSISISVVLDFVKPSYIWVAPENEPHKKICGSGSCWSLTLSPWLPHRAAQICSGSLSPGLSLFLAVTLDFHQSCVGFCGAIIVLCGSCKEPHWQMFGSGSLLSYKRKKNRLLKSLSLTLPPCASCQTRLKKQCIKFGAVRFLRTALAPECSRTRD